VVVWKIEFFRRFPANARSEAARPGGARALERSDRGGRRRTGAVGIFHLKKRNDVLAPQQQQGKGGGGFRQPH